MPPPPPPRQITAVKSNQSTSTPYSIELLTEYAHTLDSMPIDLSRIFADLRELDAVLTSTVASVTEKVYQLVELIETKSASPEQRLWLLGEIAEEASRVRPGADDKIRIATQAADNLHFQRQHLTSLATHLPEFEPAMLVPKTRYPHVSARANLPPHIYETGRRRRPPQNTNTWMGANESPAKKRRVVQEEDLDYGVVGKSPRKDKTGEGSRSRGGPRAKKYELSLSCFLTGLYKPDVCLLLGMRETHLLIQFVQLLRLCPQPRIIAATPHRPLLLRKMLLRLQNGELTLQGMEKARY